MESLCLADRRIGVQMVLEQGQKVRVPVANPVIGIDAGASQRHLAPDTGYSYYAGDLKAFVEGLLASSPEVFLGRYHNTYFIRLKGEAAAGFFDPNGKPAAWAEIFIWELGALSKQERELYGGFWGVIVGLRVNTPYRPGHGPNGAIFPL